LDILGIAAGALRTAAAGMKWKTLACRSSASRTMPASLPAKTSLGQQAVCKDAHDEQLNKK